MSGAQRYPLRQELIDQIADYVCQLPDGPRLMRTLAEAMSNHKRGDLHQSAQYFLSLGVDLFQRGNCVNPAVAERLIRLSADLASFWDKKVPDYVLPLLDGHNSLLGDANGWLGHCVTRRGRYDDAEACFNMAYKAVCEMDMKQVGEKLLCAAHIHRTHTHDVKKHKAIIAKWERMLGERRGHESECSLLHSKALMLIERQSLYTVRGKTDKAYNLGVKELLPVVERLERYKLRRQDPSISLPVVHDKLSLLAKAKERHLRVALVYRLRHFGIVPYIPGEAEDAAEEAAAAAAAAAAPTLPAAGDAPTEPPNAAGATPATAAGAAGGRNAGAASTSSAPTAVSDEDLQAMWEGKPSKNPEHDMDLAMNLKMLADLLSLQKKSISAVRHYQTAANLFKAISPAEEGNTLHLQAKCLYDSLKQPFVKDGKPCPMPKRMVKDTKEMVVALLDDAVKAKERQFGFDCKEAVESLMLRSEVLWELDDNRESEYELNRALKISREKIGDNDSLTQKVLKQLVEMKSKKKAMEDVLAKLQRQAEGPVDSLN